MISSYEARCLNGPRQRAGIDRRNGLAFQLQGQGTGLISALLVKRQITPALESMEAIPIRFSVSDKQNPCYWRFMIVFHDRSFQCISNSSVEQIPRCPDPVFAGAEGRILDTLEYVGFGFIEASLISRICGGCITWRTCRPPPVFSLPHNRAVNKTSFIYTEGRIGENLV